MLTSAREPAISTGNMARVTTDMRQLKLKDKINAAARRDVFCTIVDRRSTRVVRTNVASAASFDVNEPTLFSS